MLTTAEKTRKQINYLMEVIEDEIDIYSNSFRKTERKKLIDIMNYYGFVLNDDYEYKLYINDWGNRELMIRFYFNPDFNDGTWDRTDENWSWDNETIYVNERISY